MKISIVTPTYNGAAFLAATLDSVRAQTFSNWEQVVVDDGSADESFQIAQGYAAKDSRIRAVRQPNGGAASARNAGCARIDSQSSFVAFLDHDDIWKNDTLAQLSAILDAQPAAVAAHGLARKLDDTGDSAGAILNDERRKVVGSRIAVCRRDEPTTFATLLCDCALPTPGVALIRRQALDSIRLPNGSYLDTSVGVGSDWDLWLRLSLVGDLAFLDRVVLDWRSHGTNESRDDARMFEAETLVRRKIALNAGLSTEQQRMAAWRCRRSFASVERRNASVCRRSMEAALRRGRWSDAARLGKTWVACYRRYLQLRHSSEPVPNIPDRISERNLLLDGSRRVGII